ncbi:MAG TPA: aromatic/alkene monooxygenase hydroxylase subunit beta [Noviherbaspirillum sp.]|uniref:aromatic/alkene monooxygenase hydroxylase subunit beta n=1 Tax=Noviherbaspirillum sp. TaxID=1926288 RepID=UPI002B4783F3|nr:aromatic/alkene monooxygenase hydroxylase subunit beta [Noviherbaspirillum sp.]HJV84979.1 aromatic/alkene monooxygenase hydroxylase subunit beta [Noviherbaspirillum sp.]
MVEIRTATIEPIRNTFDHVASVLGGDKPASRYLEGTLKLQSEANFHYQALWDKEHALYDPARTKIVMGDWYKFLDPRQFHYGAYTNARSRQQEAAESNFAFVEKRNLLQFVDEAARAKMARVLIPLRHYEWGANMNNSFVASFAYGSMLNVPATFHAMDRLGIAQYLTRIGLLLGGVETIDEGKEAWIDHKAWQGLRKVIEDLFVEKDWFEVFMAQNFVGDGLVYPLVYRQFVQDIGVQGSTVAMLAEFMSDWFDETSKWVDAVVRIAAAESPQNRQQLSAWYGKWRGLLVDALRPIAAELMGSTEATLETVTSLLDARAKKLGIDAGGAQ